MVVPPLLQRVTSMRRPLSRPSILFLLWEYSAILVSLASISRSSATRDGHSTVREVHESPALQSGNEFDPLVSQQGGQSAKVAFRCSGTPSGEFRIQRFSRKAHIQRGFNGRRDSPLSGLFVHSDCSAVHRLVWRYLVQHAIAVRPHPRFGFARCVGWV